MLVKRFGTVQFEVGNDLSYLGMQISIRNAGTIVSMSFYVQQLLEGLSMVVKLSPGTKTTFVVDETSPPLGEGDRKVFHSLTAKVLYLAKRARPDILTVVSFLCTRVQSATEEDRSKLDRVLGYLKGTQDRTLLLRAQSTCVVTAYVDAAFGLHNDSRSHSGVVVFVGGTLAYVSSKKQKCMSKSPTEAELIALTDNLGLLELFRELVSFLIMSQVPMPIVYQDCTTVITLVTKGGGITRTKHLRVRMNLGKEMVDENRIRVEYVKAAGMIADGFSKPYDPAEHKPFAAVVQGEATIGK
jgi:hypothetical protein